MKIMTPFYNASLSYDDCYKYFCAHQTCKQFLEYYNVPNPERFLNTTLDFEFNISDNFLYGIQASIDYTPLLPPFSDGSFQFGDEYLPINEHNLHLLKKGYPVIIGVDIYFLPYMDSYKCTHGAHAVFLCGIDDHDAYIIDWHPPYYYRGTIDLNTLHDARFSENAWNFNTNSGGKIRYASILLEPDLFKAMDCSPKMFIKSSIQDYYHPGDESHGIKGLTHAIMYVTNMFAQYMDQRQHFFRYLHTQFFPQFSKKSLFQKRLYDLRADFPQEPWKKCVDELDTLLHSWDEILQMFLRIAYTARNIKSFVNELENMLNSILFYESNFVYALNPLIAAAKETL